MEKKAFNLAVYLREGVEDIVKGALKATASNPKESAFMARFALASREATRKREKAEENGEHIPPFLIASITSSCNLHCAGCYARAFHSCEGDVPGQLSGEDWDSVFSEAEELGISFILLAGGEPLLRRDVLEVAADYPHILFPVFTNGTLLDAEYLRLFDQKRNLLPVLSVEGGPETTDERRGSGVYEHIQSVMESIRENHLIFGVSITATTENLREITEDAFLDDLRKNGCKAVIYVEFVPVSEGSERLAISDSERQYLQDRLNEIRNQYTDMVFISFPGDEKESGGCLAAGRGFFHINAFGGAEPCPFSPYSDTSVKGKRLRDVLRSPLFETLREENVLEQTHSGGCVLFEKKDTVEKILAASRESTGG